MPTSIRRSTRNSRSRVIYSPDNQDTSKQRNRKQATVEKKKVELVQKVELVGNVKYSEEEYIEDEEVEEEPEKKKQVWENYSKKDLYFHWVKARNNATDLQKARNKLDNIRKEQAKALKEVKKELKAATNKFEKNGSVSTKNVTLQKQLDKEKAKLQRNQLEKQTLMENKEIMLKNIQESYDNMALKNELESSASLQSLQLKFQECHLKLESKINEAKVLADENKALKKKVEKFENLMFAKSKADMEVNTMDEKNQLRYVTIFFA